VAQSRHDTCVGIAGPRNDCMIGVTRRPDLAGGALGYFIGVLIELVRFIRMRKQIHDCNTAVNGSVMQ
jgi:hypothetical protein